MPVQFVGPALQGASLIGRAIPVLQNLAGSAAIGGLTSVVGTELLKPKPTGKERLQQAWGRIPENLFSDKEGNFGYRKGGGQPNYKDAQGNIYDAVSGRLLYPSKARPDYSAGEMDRQQQQENNRQDNQQAYESLLQENRAQRAENQERSRIAQLTEQDPLFKKYQVAELTKAYNSASPEDKERIGLQIWATTNPTLAKQVRPGQVGYQTSAAMSGSQVFGKDIPGVTQATYQQASEQVGAPDGVQFPGSAQAGSMNAFGMGANAQQLGISIPGQTPPSMIGENVFKQGFDVPSSENLTQTQLALLKRAFEGRLK
jgi:hypothetical protein